jgi:hypothetical protein
MQHIAHFVLLRNPSASFCTVDREVSESLHKEPVFVAQLDGGISALNLITFYVKLICERGFRNDLREGYSSFYF